MNLAEATAALAKKEAEKSQVVDEIQRLEDLKNSGVVAVLRATIVEVDEIPENSECAFHFKLNEEINHLQVVSLADKRIGEEVTFDLTEKNGNFSVFCVVTTIDTIDSSNTESETVQTSVTYKADYAIADVPQDGELRTDLIAARQRSSDGDEVEGAESIGMKLKVSMDDTMAQLASKLLELQQLEEEFNEIVTKVQDAKKKQSTGAAKAGKEKGTKKGGAGKRASLKGDRKRGSASKASNKQADEDEVPPEPEAPSYFDSITSTVMLGANYALENRAYLLFGAAAALIHFYGDYASV